MKKITFLLSAAILFASATTLRAQSLDEVLKQHYVANGQEKLLKTNAIKVTGNILQAGLEIPFIQLMKRPAMFRLEATFQGLTMVQTFDGKEGWNVNPFAGVNEPQPFGADEIRSMKYNADIDGMLWNWKEKGYSVTLEGKEEVEGTSCHKIKLTTPGEDVFTYYIDEDSFVMIRTNSKIKMAGNVTESDTYFSNYMQVEGLAMPGKIDTKMNGQLLMTIVTEKVEVDPELDKSLFGKPAK